jgi:hypothetical protein
MRQELCGLDSLDRVSYQATEFLALIIGNGGSQVLHLHKPFPNEHDLGDFGNSSHPRIANQLRIQREQPVRLFRVSARRRFPLQKAARAVESADGINVGDKVVLSSNWPREFDLQIPSRLGDLDPIVLTEPCHRLPSPPASARRWGMRADCETNPISPLFSVCWYTRNSGKVKGEVWRKFASCFSAPGFTSTREKDPDTAIVLDQLKQIQ